MSFGSLTLVVKGAKKHFFSLPPLQTSAGESELKPACAQSILEEGHLVQWEEMRLVQSGRVGGKT